MATRWYFGADSTTIVPGVSSFWGIPNDVNDRECRTSSQSPTTNASDYSNPAETESDPVYVKLNKRWKTKILTSQTINSGATFRLQSLCNEGFAAANCYLYLMVRHFNSSDVQQGSDYGNLGPTEFDDTGPVNRYAVVTLGSDITVSDGDYLIFELGIFFNNSKTTSYTGVVNHRYNPSGADVGQDETDTDNTKSAWLECSQTLNFLTGTGYETYPADEMSLADALAVSSAFKGRTPAEIVGIADALTRIMAVMRVPADSAGVTDYAKIVQTFQTDWEINPYEMMGIADTLRVRHQMTEGNFPSEAFEIFDFPARVVGYARLIE